MCEPVGQKSNDDDAFAEWDGERGAGGMPCEGRPLQPSTSRIAVLPGAVLLHSASYQSLKFENQIFIGNITI